MIATAATIDPALTKQDRVIQNDRQLLCVRFSPDGKLLFAAGLDGRLHRWNLADETHDSFEAHSGWVEQMVRHPDGKRLLTADSWGRVHCWSISADDMKPDWTIEQTSTTWLRDLAVSPDGKQIAIGGNDRVVSVFSADDGKFIRKLTGHEHHVYSVAFHNDGDSLVSGDLQGVVKHWRVSDGKCVRDFDAGKLYKPFFQYRQGGVRCMTFGDAFQTLYCAGFEGENANQSHGVPTVVAFDWAGGKQQVVMTPKEDYKGPILDIVYHPAGYLIGAGSSEAGGLLWFWKPGEANESHKVKNVTSFRGLDLDADGLRLAGTAFGDRGGQRGGNGRRLNKEGEYLGFGGHIVLYTLAEEGA